MTMHKGPGSLTTPRKRAEEIGTNKAGFDGAINYCAQCGIPSAMCKGHYNMDAEKQAHAKPGESPQKINPFKVGG